jgi:hypothetical protein
MHPALHRSQFIVTLILLLGALASHAQVFFGSNRLVEKTLMQPDLAALPGGETGN